MGSCFQGWRRKIGLMTLVWALVFMSGWLRSLITGDHVSFPPNVRRTSSTTVIYFDTLYSTSGFLMWGRSFEESTEDFDPNEISSMSTYLSWGTTDSPATNLDDPQLTWRWRCCGLGLGDFNGQRTDGVWESFLVVSYWMVAAPLTLISVWLFLPRSTTPTDRKKDGPNNALPQSQ